MSQSIEPQSRNRRSGIAIVAAGVLLGLAVGYLLGQEGRTPSISGSVMSLGDTVIIEDARGGSAGRYKLYTILEEGKVVKEGKPPEDSTKIRIVSGRYFLYLYQIPDPN